MSFPIVDIHVHPTLKPYGQTYYSNENPQDASSEACMWYSDPPSVSDDLLENILGIPPYRQSDCSSLMKGGVNVAIVALYPIEKGFVNPSLLPNQAQYTVDWITMFGRNRVNEIKSASFDYFKDLNEEYAYLQILNQKIPKNKNSSYYLVKDGADLTSSIGKESMNLIISVEGAHCFCDGNNVSDPVSWVNVESNIDKVKSWPNPPFFITLNHHFNNGLASHAQSLFIKLGSNFLFSQSEAMDTPFFNKKFISDVGRKVIDRLYDTSGGKKRILIDIKHMAEGTRSEFYSYRKDKGYQNIPLICSHTGVKALYDHTINMGLKDIKEIYSSNGLIGIEIDQRVLGFNDGEKGRRFKDWFKNIFKSKIEKERFWAEYFWLNIRWVAETCYELNPQENPWKILSLGSDLDGIINPLNKFRTAADLQSLANALLSYVQDYWNDPKSKIPSGHSCLDAHDVVYQIMYSNALNFITKNYGL